MTPDKVSRRHDGARYRASSGRNVHGVLRQTAVPADTCARNGPECRGEPDTGIVTQSCAAMSKVSTPTPNSTRPPRVGASLTTAATASRHAFWSWQQDCHPHRRSATSPALTPSPEPGSTPPTGLKMGRVSPARRSESSARPHPALKSSRSSPTRPDISRCSSAHTGTQPVTLWGYLQCVQP